MPNPKLETYKNKATGTVYDYTDAAAQAALADILDGTDIDSFSDVETALDGKVDEITGKGLSTNDYDNTAKGIVDNIQSNVIANTKLIKDTVGWSGKNKLELNILTEPITYNNITATPHNDGTVTINGTAQGTFARNIAYFDVEANQKYILSGTPYNLVNPSKVFLRAHIGENTYTWQVTDDTEGGKKFSRPTSERIWIDIRVGDGEAINNVVFKPMLRKAEILDPDYEPHFGSTAFPRSEQAVLGAKQLFKPVPITVNGVSVTVNSDGSVNASGNPEQTTSSVRIFSPSVLLKKGSYRATLISGTNLPSDAILRIATVIDGNWSTIATSEIGADAVFTLSDDVTPLGITIGMAVTSGTAINMSNIKVLITLASDTDRTFVPPAMTNKELTDKVQGIIDAATNAADFAAFKTAIGNL